MARDLVRESLSRSQALDRIEELQFHNLGRPRPGRRRRGQSSSPHMTTKSGAGPGGGTRQKRSPVAQSEAAFQGGRELQALHQRHRNTNMSGYRRSLEGLEEQRIHAERVAAITRAVIRPRHHA